MRSRVVPFMLLGSPWPAAGARADTTIVTVSGFCIGPQAASFQLLIDFLPSGPGAATVRLTAENTSGVYAFQDPVVGNPILTGIWFNVPCGAIVSYDEAMLLAGGRIVSNGADLDGMPTAAGCTQLITDTPATSWYTLVSGPGAGQYGIFTRTPGSSEGRKAGLVDPGVYVSCKAQGSVFAPIVVAGRVRFSLRLAHLPAWFNSAHSFLSAGCDSENERPPWSLAGHVEGVEPNGHDSGFVLRRSVPRTARERTRSMPQPPGH